MRLAAKKGKTMKVRKDCCCQIDIPIEIYGSINLLVNTQDQEVAWFGDVTVINSDPYNLMLQIDKVYLYPQVVSSSAVHEPKQGDGYDDWYTEKLSQANGKPILQYYGHSHVSMGVTPSLTDKDFRDQDNQLNVFSIHNKDNDMHWEVWTKEYIYNNNDILINITGGHLENTELIKIAQPKIVKPGHYYNHYNDYISKKETPKLYSNKAEDWQDNINIDINEEAWLKEEEEKWIKDIKYNYG